MQRTLHSNAITFVDYTDSRKLEVYITSNLPTIQIYDTNNQTYSPDWSTTKLQLSADIYLDSKNVTKNSIVTWYQKIGIEASIEIAKGKGTDSITIDNNQLSSSVGTITYICKAEYDDGAENSPTAHAEMVFTRVDTGRNGSDGDNAPAVQAQYSIDGITDWASVLDTASHKYIRYSYDGGKCWTAAIKMVGEDGTSVQIKGTATSVTKVDGTDYYTLIYNENIIVDAEIGDSYLYDGNLYVCADSRDDQDYFINVGAIQGPKGNDGISSYVFIRYATDANGANMSISPSGKTYIGVYTSNTNIPPTTESVYTWSKFVGDNAKNIVLSGDSQVFKVDKDNVVAPSTIKVIAQAFNTTITNWTYSINGGQTFLSTEPSGVSRNGNIITITGSAITSDSIVIKASDGEINDVFTVYKVADGFDGATTPIAFLTNENITFSANTQGQISGTTIKSNVVAYNGATKVLPTIGTITDVPSGMTVIPGVITENNEIMLTITIDDNSTLGSSSNNMGVINIPITSPINTTLSLTWSKVNAGNTGAGIKSTTVTYGVSDSASTRPADNSWQSTIPTVAEGEYLWTRTIIDYTDDTVADTVSYTYAKQGEKGSTGSAGTSVTVSSIQYQSGTSSTTAPTGTWSNSVVAVAEGSFLWTKTTFSDGKVAYGVAKQGISGSDAYTVMLTNESHIFAGDISNAIAGSATTQVMAYKGSTAQSVTITSVNGKTAALTDTDTGIAGLKFKCSALSGATPTITFTCTTSFVSSNGAIPIVISVGGVSFTKMFAYSIAFKGTTGNPGQPGTPASLVDITPSAYYFKSTTGKDGTFTPDYIYLYPRFQTVTYSKWEYSTNGGASWTTVNNASGTGIAVVTHNSISNTLRISRSSPFYTDTVTSISFKCVSSDSSVYDTVSIAKIYDVVDLNIGGRNLLLNTSFDGGLNKIYNLPSSITSGEGGLTFNLSESLPAGTEVALRFQIRGLANVNVYWMMTGGNVAQTVRTKNNISTTEFSTIEIRYTVPSGKTLNSVFICTAYGNSVAGTDWFEIKTKSLQLELGNTFTDWHPAPEDLKSTTFQLYAPKGYLITYDVPEVTLQTFAYDGSQPITSGAFKWYHWVNEEWVVVNGATGASLTLTKADVLKSGTYKCEMTYKGTVYTATETVEDKTDVYESLIRINAKRTSNNDMYWVLYATVYSEEGEKDALLGPISEIAPASPTSGTYWYQINPNNYSVALKKYSGTAWVNSTDQQELSYDWFLFKDSNDMVSLGDKSKVKIIKSGDFANTCNVQCNIFDAENTVLSRNNQVLNDPTDPIISDVAPTNPINGQIWIKVESNGSYVLSVWSVEQSKWIVSNADTQNKVYVTKPTQYNTGDLWIVDSNYLPVAYENEVAQNYKHPEKTMLRAIATSSTYSDAHWVEALKYQEELNEVITDVNKFKQFLSVDTTGLTMQAKNANGTVSEFKTMLTNTELGFYQGDARVAYINNNQLNISKAQITNGLSIGGTTPMLELGNFLLIQEANGSLSIG